MFSFAVKDTAKKLFNLSKYIYIYIWGTLEREQLSNWAFGTIEECIEQAKEFGIEGSIMVIETEPYEPYMTADSFLELLLEQTINRAIQKYIEDTGCTLNAYEVTENERVVNLEE